MLDVDGNEHVDKKEFLKVCIRLIYFFIAEISRMLMLFNRTLCTERIMMLVSKCVFKCQNITTFIAASVMPPQL